MITFDALHLEEGIPIYQQILLYLKRGIAAGEFCDGDELPSRRVLSALLGVNPNTVQKAYRQLEEEDIIHSHTGAKSYIVVNEEKVKKIRAELLKSDVKRVVQSMQQMGLSKSEALRLIQEYWD